MVETDQAFHLTAPTDPNLAKFDQFKHKIGSGICAEGNQSGLNKPNLEIASLYQAVWIGMWYLI